jgi:hypothetical protein
MKTLFLLIPFFLKINNQELDFERHLYAINDTTFIQQYHDENGKLTQDTLTGHLQISSKRLDEELRKMDIAFADSVHRMDSIAADEAAKKMYAK